MLEERRERIQVLLGVLGNFNNLTTELSAQPACYPEIIDCVDAMIETLKESKARLEKIKEEIADASSHSDDGVDPA